MSIYIPTKTTIAITYPCTNRILQLLSHLQYNNLDLDQPCHASIFVTATETLKTSILLLLKYKHYKKYSSPQQLYWFNFWLYRMYMLN